MSEFTQKVDITDASVTIAGEVSLAAGTNSIGKLGANSGIDIGDVDVSSVSGDVATRESTTNIASATANYTSVQTNVALIAAAGAGVSIYITDLVVSNGATAGYVKFVEDTAGSATVLVERLNFAANGGAVINFRTPLKGTANTNFGLTSVTADDFSVTVCYYTE